MRLTGTPAISGFMIMVALLMGGCNIVGPIAYLTAPEPTVDAKFELQNRPTVVFIDDRDNIVNPVSLRRVIVEQVTENLLREKLVTTMISPRDAIAVASQYDRHNDLIPISEIGRSVGAEQVIYIKMEAFVPSVDGITPRAGAVAHVKVLDVVNQSRLHPPPDQAQLHEVVQAITGEYSQEMYRTRAQRMQVMQALAAMLGDRIAKLFYEHTPDRTLGSNLTPPSQR